MNRKVLLIGAGRQGKAVIHDLERSSLVNEVVAADRKAAQRAQELRSHQLQKTRLVEVEASRLDDLSQLLQEESPAVVICLLPPSLVHNVAQVAVSQQVHFVGVSYTKTIATLHEEAQRQGVTLLPEMGMDPGIDLILGRLALEELDTVWGLHSYAGGIPDARAAQGNPLGYKITWTFQGVLESYTRPAKLLHEGEQLHLEGHHIFDPEHVHTLDIPAIGTLEAFPNGDALRYAQLYGLDEGSKDVGRFALRWPGHCSFWRTMGALGFLETTPVEINGAQIPPIDFLVKHLSPRLQFQKGEKDLAILRAHAWGFREGTPIKAAYNVVDTRDMKTGFFAMNRTVGFAASIGAQMILDGTIKDTGVLSPVRHVPPHLFLEALEKRGIHVERQITEE